MHDRRTQKLSFFISLAVAVLLIGGAIALKLTRVEERLTLWGLNDFFRSEYFHVSAHIFLYGTLTAGIYGVLRRQWRRTLQAVMTLGLVQEAAQSLLFGRAMGSGELCDLGIDLLSASLVLLTIHWARQRFLVPVRQEKS